MMELAAADPQLAKWPPMAPLVYDELGPSILEAPSV